MDGVLPAVKAALTKAYNKGSSSRISKTADLITLPGMKKAPKKRVAAMLEPVDESLPESGENEEESLSDDEDQGTYYHIHISFMLHVWRLLIRLLRLIFHIRISFFLIF